MLDDNIKKYIKNDLKVVLPTLESYNDMELLTYLAKFNMLQISSIELSAFYNKYDNLASRISSCKKVLQSIILHNLEYYNDEGNMSDYLDSLSFSDLYSVKSRIVKSEKLSSNKFIRTRLNLDKK